MKTYPLGIFALAAMTFVGVPLAPANEPAAGTAVVELSPVKLDELLGPVALFPDNLVALILPASTNPSDVVLAARYLDRGGDPNRADQQPWDESVRALVHYPSLVQWLDDHLDWLTDLGAAFEAQPAEVMGAIQRLRRLARECGNLNDTAEQRIVEEKGRIIIVPAKPDVIYIPTYDPAVVYVRHTYVRRDPVISFSLGFVIGSWLAWDCDWHNHRIWIGDCYRPWNHHRPWRHAHYVPAPGPRPPWRAWCPPPHHRHPRPPHHGHFRPPAPFPREHYRPHHPRIVERPGHVRPRHEAAPRPGRPVERRDRDFRPDRRERPSEQPVVIHGRPFPRHSVDATPAPRRGPAPERVAPANPPPRRDLGEGRRDHRRPTPAAPVVENSRPPAPRHVVGPRPNPPARPSVERAAPANPAPARYAPPASRSHPTAAAGKANPSSGSNRGGHSGGRVERGDRRNAD